MATTTKKTTRTKSAKPDTQAEATPKVVELEVNLDEFSNLDYEIMDNWASGNSGKHSLKEIFDILDRVIVGGFRHRRFVDIKETIKAVLEQIGNAAMGDDQKN